MIIEKYKLKPNFSALSRKFHVDRRTVKKYYEGYNKHKTRVRKSKIDSLHRRRQEMIANVKLIEAVLQKYSAYKIGKETGISYSTVNDWKKGITSVYGMKLEYAIKLTEYAIQEKIEVEEN